MAEQSSPPAAMTRDPFAADVGRRRCGERLRRPPRQFFSRSVLRKGNWISSGIAAASATSSRPRTANATASPGRARPTRSSRPSSRAASRRVSQGRTTARRSVNFDTTGNLFIEGDNLEVLKLLHRSYHGRVKMIYIDPPYNTGREFIYPDNYAEGLRDYLEFSKQVGEGGTRMGSNADTNGRYHSKWLSMMYPRLFLARQLLRDDGVIFISIDDHEVHNLRMVMNEIFGEENFVATIIWQKVYSPKNTARHFSEDHDFIIAYARNAERWTPALLPRTGAANARYENVDSDSRGAWKSGDMTARNYYAQGQYTVTSPSGNEFRPPTGRYWAVSEPKFAALNRDNRIWWGAKGDNAPALKRFLSEVKQGMVPQTLWKYEEVGHTQEGAEKGIVGFRHFREHRQRHRLGQADASHPADASNRNHARRRRHRPRLLLRNRHNRACGAEAESRRRRESAVHPRAASRAAGGSRIAAQDDR